MPTRYTIPSAAVSARICSLVIAADGCMRILIRGSSMSPLIGQGTMVNVKAVSGLRPGYCYLFDCNGSLLLHRLVRYADSTVVFRGDASGSVERVPARAVIAELVDSSSHSFRSYAAMVNMVCTTPFLSFSGKIPAVINRIRQKSIRLLLHMDRIF